MAWEVPVANIFSRICSQVRTLVSQCEQFGGFLFATGDSWPGARRAFDGGEGGDGDAGGGEGT